MMEKQNTNEQMMLDEAKTEDIDYEAIDAYNVAVSPAHKESYKQAQEDARRRTGNKRGDRRVRPPHLRSRDTIEEDLRVIAEEMRVRARAIESRWGWN